MPVTISQVVSGWTSLPRLRVDWVGESCSESITLCGVEGEDIGAGQALCPDCAQLCHPFAQAGDVAVEAQVRADHHGTDTEHASPDRDNRPELGSHALAEILARS